MKHLKTLECIKTFRPKPLTSETHTAMSKNLKLFSLKNAHLIYKHHFPASEYLNILNKMNRIGSLADNMDHHPEWTLHGESLTIGLSTHEIGGEVSIKDYILGFWIEQILSEESDDQVMIRKWNELAINYE